MNGDSVNKLGTKARTLLQKRRVLLGIVLLCGLWGLRKPLSHAILDGPQSPDVDRDCGIILYETLSKPTLRDTGAWWVGPWQPVARYYRPITITLFWLELKAWGMQGLRGFTLVHAASHLALLALAFLFFAELLGKAPAVVGVSLYAVHFADRLTLPAADVALDIWKDNCDVWCATAIIGCLWALLRYLTTARRGWLCAAVFLFVVAICIKEGGYQIPFMVVLLLWHQRRLRSHWWVAAIFFVLAALGWKYRLWALGGWGERTGANRMWPMRWANDAAGLRGGMVTNDYLTLSIIAYALGFYYMLQRKLKPVLIYGSLATLGLVLTAYRLDMPVAEVASRLLVEEPWSRLPFAIVTVWLYWRLYKRRERGQIYAYLFIAIAFIPLSSQPMTSNHALYFVALGWGLFLGYAVIDLWEIVTAHPAVARLMHRPALATPTT